MSLWREDQANKNKDGRIPTGKALITIHKDKDGPTGKCELAFEGKYTRFGNIEQDQEEPRIPYAD
jgi:replicative DNA helicase